MLFSLMISFFRNLIFGQLAVTDATRLLEAEATELIGLIVGVTALKEEDITIALERKNVRTDAIEEPTVVADDHGTTRETL
jgi:hypothetical protein